MCLSMDYSIPETVQDTMELGRQPVSPEVVAAAIAGVVQMTRRQGRSLEDLLSEVLEEDQFLDAEQRHWLSGIVRQAWEVL